jgi:hypothetical protein
MKKTMAKRYFDYSEVEKIEGSYKPYGTMGSHNFKVLSKSPQGITVQGSTGKTVFLKPGWTLGYDCGDVWAIKPADKISDPIQKFLRKNKFSSKTPVRVSDEILSGNVKTASAANPSGCIWVGSAWYSNWGHESRDNYSPIEDGDVVLRKSANAEPRFFSASHVKEVVIRSHVTPESLAEIFANGDFNISPRLSAQEKKAKSKGIALAKLKKYRIALEIVQDFNTSHITVPSLR